MDDAVIHARTRAQLEHFLSSPSHAILLTGAAGSGKTFVAEQLAAVLLDATHEKLASQPYFMAIRPVKNAISIDVIRALQRFTQLKTIGNNAIRRVAIVEHAHVLSGEAQNALLKLLEEPPEDTVLILTAHNSRSLLPTIRSRLQTIALLPPEAEQLKAYFESRATSAQNFTQQLLMSGGLPGLLQALLADDAEHPLVAAIQQAKVLLQADAFERMTQVDALSKQKETAGIVLEALMRIAQAGLDQAAAKSSPAQIRRWHHVLEVAHAANVELAANVNAKLVFTNLMLHI